MKVSEIPREQIPWFPTINPALCTGDQTCVAFCQRTVFAWDPSANRPVVAQPYNCMVGCDGCASVCPANAIALPTLEWLGEFVEQYRATEPAPG